MSEAPVCASCDAAVSADARFCEVCGARLAPEPAGAADAPPAAPVTPTGAAPAPAPADVPGGPGACRACGGTIAADGYCELCGQPAASARDHWSERPSPHVGGVCDRGVRHHRNEDAMALAAHGAFAALVVCDGVSTARDSDVASLAASRAALDVLLTGAPQGAAPVSGPAPARAGAWSALLRAAAVAGDDAIRTTMSAAPADGAAPGAPDDVPSCTFVAAVLDSETLVVGWLGDSRAYWLPDAGPAEQLTADDSWAGELMLQGVPRATAETSPQAHAITRWLGPDAHDVVARTTATVVDEPGWVLVCSDGLWNYCSPAEDLSRLLRAAADRVGTAPDALAGALVTWANEQGGRDNVTVALARVGAAVAARPVHGSSDSLVAGTAVTNPPTKD
ncbi:protein phosphatase 2C domain-containing protein [Cellulomonas sp.]|uniref:PP2C family protein-serine/threonine phosphatase n=1 Tax=Cellulomonas sp. TaxID=40001 RepID=UPI00258504BE|nr:protein phosphatase 2C domain-containing protein [Cellulomonas sp.]MCR6690178.1 protein phosphatase 2C domain-containing protein [Cellulomonas sp.]